MTAVSPTLSAWRAASWSGPAWLATGLVLLAALCVTSLAVGQMAITPRTVLEAFRAYDPGNTEHLIVTTTRLSRTVVAVVVGASLALAGALMQALTRNPLASPGLFGVNAGAMFCVVALTAAGWLGGLAEFIWAAFAGAALAGASIYALGATGLARMSSLRMVLAGAAVSALFVALTQAMLVVNQEGLESVLFWLAGSVAGRELAIVGTVLPYPVAAGLLAVFMARHVDVLAAGEEIAVGLGQRTGWIKVSLATCVVLLAGSAVALAGAIGFIGLLVPHAARRMVGASHRWLLPACAIYGACLLLAADIAARVAASSQEIPVGVLTALLGTPCFILLIRRGWRHE